MLAQDTVVSRCQTPFSWARLATRHWILLSFCRIGKSLVLLTGAIVGASWPVDTMQGSRHGYVYSVQTVHFYRVGFFYFQFPLVYTYLCIYHVHPPRTIDSLGMNNILSMLAHIRSVASKINAHQSPPDGKIRRFRMHTRKSAIKVSLQLVSAMCVL